MSTFALISGTLFRGPERRVSSTGETYATATVRVQQGDDLLWWRVGAFDRAIVEELVGLGYGDAITVSGPPTIGIYEDANGPRLSLSLIADRIISVRRKRRERADAAASPADAKPFGYEVTL